MSLRTTVHLVHFIVFPVSFFVLFTLGKKYGGVVYVLLMCLLTIIVGVWGTSLRCPNCKAWLVWQRMFLVCLPRSCRSCGHDLGRKERRG